MKPEDIELIDWYDHVQTSSNSGWVGMDDIDNTASTIRSVGWIVAENDLCVTMISHGNVSSDGDEYQGVMTILKDVILERKKLV